MKSKFEEVRSCRQKNKKIVDILYVNLVITSKPKFGWRMADCNLILLVD